MSETIYKVTQERVVIILANNSADAKRQAIKAFDKKQCYIRETVKKEN
jgi:hypothetical protein